MESPCLVQHEFVPCGFFFFLMNLSPHLGLLGVDLRIFFFPRGLLCCLRLGLTYPRLALNYELQVQDDLLPPSPECRDYMHRTPCLFYVVMEIDASQGFVHASRSLYQLSPSI